MFKLFALLFITVLPVTAAPVRVDIAVDIRKLECAREIDQRAREAIVKLHAQNGIARVDRLDKIGRSLKQSGVRREIAEKIETDFLAMLKGEIEIPALRSIVRWHSDLKKEQHPLSVEYRTLVCMLSKECSESAYRRNHAFAVNESQILFIVPVLGDEPPSHFVMNLFGSIELLTGQQTLAKWAQAGYQLTNNYQEPDIYWKLFVEKEGNQLFINESFFLLATRMRAERLSSELFAHYYRSNPDSVAANNAHFEKLVPEITADAKVAELAHRLGVFENGYLKTAATIGDAMENTILRYQATLH